MTGTPTVCPYCGADLDGTGTCARCGGARTQNALTGWRPDPTARFEGRYYVAGRPTNRVRNGRAQSDDPVGGRMLPAYVEVPAARSSIRSTWLATGVTTAVIAMVGAVIGALLWAGHRPGRPPETDYVQALETAGLMNQFNSQANAVAHGHDVCSQLEHGGPQQGVLADKIAVDSFCPQFNQGFRVLESAKISGVFVLTDSLGTGAIETDGASCRGTNGYADVGSSTPVIVKNDKGETLTTTSLGAGKSDGANCTFSFSFPITEGQDRYVVSVGRRGEFSYSFEQLLARGVQIHLGH
ncbi:DUF732 domain-containing protein [Mycobacterium sp. CVI_P3]|uniref:DUF732 domain-containing protein n=1 Tax=Mycobacterium pinniadriaticum TaxID=2994102 RepID=A0ABT3S8F7_9MYCO|nr:DUF732 domain-containing protein [Mycobacterium pinniadriaticum]MCX2929357.1 DUF732 domain-containing protein [Mycobacterium pinniadriaticum]MCX2935781.1 DUF732 domain-containing protein [Mycobacterium pinniadriaticum]